MTKTVTVWLSVEQLAAYLGVKADTIYKWLYAGKIPGHKVGRLWRFDRDEIDRWVRKK